MKIEEFEWMQGGLHHSRCDADRDRHHQFWLVHHLDVVAEMISCQEWLYLRSISRRQLVGLARICCREIENDVEMVSWVSQSRASLKIWKVKMEVELKTFCATMSIQVAEYESEAGIDCVSRGVYNEPSQVQVNASGTSNCTYMQHCQYTALGMKRRCGFNAELDEAGDAPLSTRDRCAIKV